MKKVFLFVIALCFVITTQVQATEVTTTRGNLKKDLEAIVGAGNLVTITDLKIIGTVTSTDFTDVSTYFKSSLQTIDLSGVTGFDVNTPTTLPKQSFLNWTALKTVTLPEGGVITTIGEGAFYTTCYNCSNLESVNIPESVTRIEQDAFNGTPKLKTLKLPDGLLFLSGYRTFRRSGITAIEIPANTQIIKTGNTAVDADGMLYQTFQETPITTFKVPDNVVTITNGAFQYSQLSSITFSDQGNLRKLGGLGYTYLTSLKVPEGVTELETGVLYGTSTLETVELPSTLEKIGNSAFNSCSGLKSITNYSDSPVNLSAAPAVFTGVDKTQCILYVPEGSKEAYLEADGWKEFGDNIKVIGSDAVESEIENFEDLTVGKGVEPVTLNATTKGDRPVTYSIEAGKESVATLQGNVLTIVGEGTAQITASVEGDNDYQAAEKTITLTVVDYSWLEEVSIAVMGNQAMVVGPAESVAKFTRFYIGDTAIDGNSADISAATGELSLKAATSDGSEVIKLKINKQ